MATAVVMPKQGQSVESCIIVGWKKNVGDPVAEGDVLGEIETDKALLEVESPVSGTLLALFFDAGEEVPVLTNIGAVGEPGEEVEHLRPGRKVEAEAKAEAKPEARVNEVAEPTGFIKASPRARNLAAKKAVDLSTIRGSGPDGRIIERDVQTAPAAQPAITPLAKTMVARGGYAMPAHGSGIRGRIMAGDLEGAATQTGDAEAGKMADEVEILPLKGIRSIIAARMIESLQTTAQLTFNASADAQALQAYRQRLKAGSEALGLQNVSVNDLILFVTSRVLGQFPDFNAILIDEALHRYKHVHLGFAVDTPRGLMVPVIKYANLLSLKQISQEAARLSRACLDGAISPDEMSGGSFTVSNLGSLGIESFTPILNAPQVGILGVNKIDLKPVEVEGEVQFIPHLGLSVTVNHQVIDGAPAARFLQAMARGVEEIDLLLAI